MAGASWAQMMQLLNWTGIASAKIYAKLSPEKVEHSTKAAPVLLTNRSAIKDRKPRLTLVE
jgi:hypothetical protein